MWMAYRGDKGVFAAQLWRQEKSLAVVQRVRARVGEVAVEPMLCLCATELCATVAVVGGLVGGLALERVGSVCRPHG